MTNTLRDNIVTIISKYPLAKKEPFSKHPLASFIRHDFPVELRALVEGHSRYKIDGSAGQGQWTNCPWVATFDILITETAQSGYYPVYLFREDMQGVFLSLNQGVTNLMAKYKSDARNVLQVRAADFRAQIGVTPESFPLTKIDLATVSKSDIASYYEAGNIYAIYYSADNLPPNDKL